MNKVIIRIITSLCGLILSFTLSMCCSMNNLRGYAFRDHTAAALLEFPPQPQIFTDDWTNVNWSNPVEAFIDIGTGIAKEVEVSKARAKLVSAMDTVDIPEIIRIETLNRGSEYLHYHPIDNTRDAYFLFDIELRNYGIEAHSWTSGVYFKIDVKITLMDNNRGKEIWRSCFNEHYPVSREIFGLPNQANDIITAVALSNLTSDQIAAGLKNLAFHTCDQIISKLRSDFSSVQQ
jgi:hypothetical protein